MRTILSILLTFVFLGSSPAWPQTDEERARLVGLEVSARLTDTLKAALQEALQSGGPAAALMVCSLKAQELTRWMEADLRIPGLAVKRTSLKIRNPRNAPDMLEEAILQAYDHPREPGEATDVRVVLDGEVFRVFTPIYTQPLCMLCHGPKEYLSQPVRQALAERYPTDRATGYWAGELRGMISISIPKILCGTPSENP